MHAVNPPGYRDWDKLVLPMLDNTIAAAQAQGATIVLPGTVYNYGADAFPVLKEDPPQHPATRKGAIRVELEARLERAASTGAARVLIVRAGDFFGPRAGNNWFAQGLIKPGQPVRAVNYAGRAGRWPSMVLPARRGAHHGRAAGDARAACRRSRAFTWPGTGTTTDAR